MRNATKPGPRFERIFTPNKTVAVSRQANDTVNETVGGFGCGAMSGVGNERTHYTVPNSTADVILYRTHTEYYCASHRASPTEPWCEIQMAPLRFRFKCSKDLSRQAKDSPYRKQI